MLAHLKRSCGPIEEERPRVDEKCCDLTLRCKLACLEEIVHSRGSERWGGGLTKTIYNETNHTGASHLWKAKDEYDLYEGCRVPWSIASKWRALVPFILVMPATRTATKNKEIHIYVHVLLNHYKTANIFITRGCFCICLWMYVLQTNQ